VKQILLVIIHIQVFASDNVMFSNRLTFLSFKPGLRMATIWESSFSYINQKAGLDLQQNPTLFWMAKVVVNTLMKVVTKCNEV